MEYIENNINDILDVDGKKVNFLTDKQYSEEYIKLSEKWRQLPMYKDKSSVKNFFNLLHNKQVILLISGTGSGKTVLVPKFFLKYVKMLGLNGKIAITNPKILTTMYNAEYGAKTLDVKLGEEVGYKYKGAPQNSIGPNTKLLYVTDGLILATILSGDTLLSEYQGIIIDEAHERHIQIDILLRLIKNILPIRPEFKLIIMSATINPTIFKDYFDNSNISFGIIEVSGESNYPITQNWLDPKIKINRSNYIDVAVERCLNIIDTTKTGDILIFVPTQNDAIKGCQSLKKNCPEKLKTKKTICDKLYCVEVFSKMKLINKDMAVSKDLYKTKGFDRKIIFATNVAESSITFDGLIYVIETGFELANYYVANSNSYVISKKYTSQAQIKQRIGRAGRTQPGVSYHLYTKDSYNNLKLYPEPNISVIDLTDIILSLIKYSKTINNFISVIKDLITVPRIEQITYGIYKLYFNKCLKLIDSKSDNILNIDSIKWHKINSYDKMLDTFNGTLTSIGINILRFKSSSVLSALAMLMSKYMNCETDIAIIMAAIEISNGKLESVFDIDSKKINIIIKYFEKITINGSDHLTFLNIYKENYLTKNYKYLNRKLFDNIEKRATQLLMYVNKISTKTYKHMKIKYKLVQSDPYNDIQTNITYVLALSHLYNLLQKKSNNIYTSVNFIENSVAPLEYFKLTPPIKKHTNFVICNSLSDTFGRKNFQCLTQIPDSIMVNILKNEDINNALQIKLRKII
jgi:pre-mRNA-splicing factor ATP-dependent RNA helicase DHX15/PRP43